jgi:hypothetical protein
VPTELSHSAHERPKWKNPPVRDYEKAVRDDQKAVGASFGFNEKSPSIADYDNAIKVEQALRQLTTIAIPPEPVVTPPEEELQAFDPFSEQEGGAFDWEYGDDEPPLLL